jgi:zinc-dependent metalloproteinase lipoprotein
MKNLLLTLCLLVPMILVASCEDNNGNGQGNEGGGEELGRMVIPDNTLPVIFHFLYEDEGDVLQNPPATLVKERIDQLNKFYAGTLYPGAGSVNTGIKFMLATHDPQGRKLKEPGIDRVYRAGSNNMTSGWFMSRRAQSVQDKAVNWDQNQYVNVWVFGIPESENVAGRAHYPYTQGGALPGVNRDDQGYYMTHLPAYMHGISLNNRYFSTPDGMSTLFHEMGHYLGLLHTFIETFATNPYCAPVSTDYDDDFCTDTPIYSRAEYENNYSLYQKYRTSCNGIQFLSTNVMDYWYGDEYCITPDQQERIDWVYANSPLIPRPLAKTKALLDNYTGVLGDKMPEPIWVECEFGVLNKNR